jgi:hypothetical protein
MILQLAAGNKITCQSYQQSGVSQSLVPVITQFGAARLY